MVDRNLLREFDVNEDELDSAFEQSLADENVTDMAGLIEQSGKAFNVGEIVEGKIVNVIGDQVLVDVGYKSEGLVPLNEWEEDEEAAPGNEIEVLLEGLEDDGGEIVLSKRKAARIRGWERVTSQCSEGDVVTGRVTRKIKGGLLVDIGVNVFLPASQVDIRRPHDIADYIEQDIQCKILKIDESRRNIVVSRRKLIEEQREEMKRQLLSSIKEGDVVKGVVKNIADFGAFVDLGGIDGLLHITDMSWGRISHPSELVNIDQELDVKILHVDYDKEKIALGLKQLSESPWEKVPNKYPVNSKIKGEVVNVMSYGAFVKLEDGIEGLVHISEMSWTKRINHPSELVQVGEEVEVVVLGINEDKQEISLGMKQTQDNPWEAVAEKYPTGTTVGGVVRNLTNYGAFVELEDGIDGLLHVSDMSWTRKISHPNEVIEKGQQVECQVLSVDQDRKRIALGLKQMKQDPWETDIPSKYQPGDMVAGKITKITNFGVFVELEQGLEGLLHISELADHKVENPEDEVKVGDEVEVKILRVDTDDRKIGLSRKRAQWAKDGEEPETETADAADHDAARRPEPELQGGLGGGGGLLIDPNMGRDKSQTTSEDSPATPANAPAEDAAVEDSPEQSVATEDSPEQSVATEDSPEQSVATEDSPEPSVAAEDSPEQSVAAEDSPEQSVVAEDSPEPSVAAEDSPEQSVAAEDPAERPAES